MSIDQSYATIEQLKCQSKQLLDQLLQRTNNEDVNHQSRKLDWQSSSLDTRFKQSKVQMYFVQSPRQKF